jgi:dolichol-phosphate mannosyltransferase
MDGKDFKVSVVLPAFREKENLSLLVPRISKALAKYTHEILVVDDNSQDGTEEAMTQLQQNQKIPVRTIVRKTNRGFAFSIREGIEKATGDALVIMDSDGNHDPDYLPMMIANLNFYDCVSGTRFQYGGRMDSRKRYLLSWLFNAFVRVMTRKYITDSLYGFIAIRKAELMKVNFDKVFWGYGDYCIRLLYYLQCLGVSILQFPAENGIRHHGEGNSRFIKVFFQYFSAVIKLVVKEKLYV